VLYRCVAVQLGVQLYTVTSIGSIIRVSNRKGCTRFYQQNKQVEGLDKVLEELGEQATIVGWKLADRCRV